VNVADELANCATEIR